MSYLLMVSHGSGRRYVWGHEIDSIIRAEDLARKQAAYLNEHKSPRAPKVTVTVLRKVGEYGSNNASPKAGEVSTGL
jgi:hypothetical protein